MNLTLRNAFCTCVFTLSAAITAEQSQASILLDGGVRYGTLDGYALEALAAGLLDYQWGVLSFAAAFSVPAHQETSVGHEELFEPVGSGPASMGGTSLAAPESGPEDIPAPGHAARLPAAIPQSRLPRKAPLILAAGSPLRLLRPA